MPRIAAIGTAVPPHGLAQQEIRDAALRHFDQGLRETQRLISVFNNVRVHKRYLCVPLEWYADEHSFSETNREYIRWAIRLSQEAISDCLNKAGLKPEDVDQLVFVSTSGMSTPSIDAHLINRMGFPTHIKRTPIFGLGCAGGAAGLSRLGDLSQGSNGHRLLMVAVELSSLTFQFRDFSKSNLVASSLFSDGAAAVLINGRASPPEGPRIVSTLSTIWPDTLEVMGWDFSETGLGVIFSRQIPQLIGHKIRDNVEQFLAAQGLGLGDVDHFLVHPGGAKVLDSFQKTLGLDPERLEQSRYVLENYGNMSSPTILFILERYCRLARPREGEYGLCAAFGPGFSSELLLLQW